MNTRLGSAGRPAFFWMVVAAAALLATGCSVGEAEIADRESSTRDAPPVGPAPAVPAAPSVMAATPEASGRYLVQVGGCNDCHTDGFVPSGGKMPESTWLTGSAVGLRGPWGTTYPSNLRLTVQTLTEDEWVTMLGTRTAMPPMPWPSVAALSEADRRAVYRFIRGLGPAGEPAPATLPPDREPTTPWIDFVPRNLSAQRGE